ncbi:hypothetical protein Aperf_G00000123934 [Anoplocephala perfoliata]
MNKAYFKTIPGIVKCLILLFSFIALICGCVGIYNYRVLFVFTAILGFAVELIFFICYVFDATFSSLSLVDFACSFVLTILSLVCFIVACVFATQGAPQDGASAFFWAVLFLLYCVDCFYCFRAYRGISPRPAKAASGPTFATGQPGYSGFQSEPQQGNFGYAN